MFHVEHFSKDKRERVAFSRKKATMTQKLFTTPKHIYT